MLTFIKNIALKKAIKDSIEYMNILFDSANDSSSNAFKEETYRVIILYVVAVIEAVLLCVLKERDDQISVLDYKIPREICKKVKHQDYPQGTFVTAIQCKEIKPDQQIGVQDLVMFMVNNKLMKDDTAKDILEINNIRNTFHLNKPRTDIKLELNKVEKAFSLLYKIIKGAPKAIIKKP
jgi:hypothetical protein